MGGGLLSKINVSTFLRSPPIRGVFLSINATHLYTSNIFEYKRAAKTDSRSTFEGLKKPILGPLLSLKSGPRIGFCSPLIGIPWESLGVPLRIPGRSLGIPWGSLGGPWGRLGVPWGARANFLDLAKIGHPIPRANVSNVPPPAHRI